MSPPLLSALTAALGPLRPAGGLGAARITRLPSLTNEVYRVEDGALDVVVRLPRPGDRLDRTAEPAALARAEMLGLGARVLRRAEGTLVTASIPGAAPLTPAALGTPGVALAVARALRRLHDGPPLGHPRPAWVSASGYLEVLGAALPRWARQLHAGVAARFDPRDLRPARIAPCHGDPTAGNWLGAGDRLWLVDWEYAGDQSPLWDLAAVAEDAALDDATPLLTAWAHGPPGADLRATLHAQRALYALLCALWAAALSHARGDDALLAAAERAAGRCEALLGAEPGS